MYHQTKNCIYQEILRTLKTLDFLWIENFSLETSKNVDFGYLSSNVAFLVSAKYHRPLNEVAELIVKSLESIEHVEKIENKSGFINFFLKKEVFNDWYGHLIKEKDSFGKRNECEKQYAIELISANPNGSLHLGHIRSGIYTDAMISLLEFFGRKVIRLYLVNDKGSQVKEIVRSVFAKYNFLLYGICYDELRQIKYNTVDAENCAKAIIKEKGSVWTYGKSLDDPEFYEEIRSFVVDYFVKQVSIELKHLNINIDVWDSEKHLSTENAIQASIEKIKNYVYIKDGALWFKTSYFYPNATDDVIIKSDDDLSYFGQDLIYHLHKISYLNKTGVIINCFACDHEGHIVRLKAFFKALGEPEGKLVFKVMQLARLVDDNNKRLAISKRNNQLITCNDLFSMMNYEEIRWYFSAKESDMELDINLSKLKNKDYNNQIFYVLYAYARSEQILNKVEISDIYDRPIDFDELKTREENAIIKSLLCYKDMLEKSVEELKPNLCCLYLLRLAQEFHSFYETCNILKEENNNLKNQRLGLCYSVKQILSNCLSILKISPKARL